MVYCFSNVLLTIHMENKYTKLYAIVNFELCCHTDVLQWRPCPPFFKCLLSWSPQPFDVLRRNKFRFWER